ncbi:MAG: class I SAM-dependent methyltransferase [Lachnospiraceae bacterium]|nr:class I SAM-dependent methyltransferase [Lachnospiraceae bacterium]
MSISDKNTVEKQYNTSNHLNTRISIHDKYSTNKQGFGNWITSHYDIREGMKVLELGCGTGSMWVGKGELVAKCSQLILSDFSAGMLEQTKSTLADLEGIEYQVIDIQNIPYADQTFDVVIANMMLYHVPDLERGLREVRRVLKEDGTFYCATYGENGIMEYIYGLFEKYDVKASPNHAFTMQNGADKLGNVFDEVKRFNYEDALEVTNFDDMADYVYSLAGMSGLENVSRETMLQVLNENAVDGVLRVPKDYGMFTAKSVKRNRPCCRS